MINIEAERLLETVDRLGIRGASRELGLPYSSLHRFLSGLKTPIEETTEIIHPKFPSDDISVREIIDMMKKRFEKRKEAKQAKKWFPIKINSNLPIGIALIGDPHIDDDGCNWPLLDADIEIMRDTPGIYAVNMGDTTNGSWPGRLMRLFGNQETSMKTARRLAKWFLRDSGINWLVWLLGNHDEWQDGSDVLREMNISTLPMEEWQAQFKLVFPNEKECRIWAAHDFKGSSEWNSLHSMQKAAHKKDWAHIYCGGHTHNWALHQEESASREFTYWLARARGYKFLDHYAELLGHQSQRDGATILCVINPMAENEASFVQCFADLKLGADYLTYLRSKASK
jgi:Calcineurin-like phosphoesterase